MNNQIPYPEPEFNKDAFNCPNCDAFAKQNWSACRINAIGQPQLACGLMLACCEHCENFSIWLEQEMIYPDYSGVPLPNSDLSEEIRADYQEAAKILYKSPRGAAALLRLAIQKLCNQLGKTGTVNKMIGELANDGLLPKVQKALDTVRVLGDEAVHPGQIDLKDDTETAAKLFQLVNFIAEKMITEPKEIETFFDEKVSDSKKDQINHRNNNG